MCEYVTMGRKWGNFFLFSIVPDNLKETKRILTLDQVLFSYSLYDEV
jgi:hypothetical protein